MFQVVPHETSQERPQHWAAGWGRGRFLNTLNTNTFLGEGMPESKLAASKIVPVSEFRIVTSRSCAVSLAPRTFGNLRGRKQFVASQR